MLNFEQSFVVYLVTMSLFQHFSNNMKHLDGRRVNNDCNSQKLAQSSARLWVRGSVLALGRARLELGTTRICSTTAERLGDLLEVG